MPEKTVQSKKAPEVLKFQTTGARNIDNMRYKSPPSYTGAALTD
jgi:hypothetical protein